MACSPASCAHLLMGLACSGHSSAFHASLQALLRSPTGLRANIVRKTPAPSRGDWALQATKDVKPHTLLGQLVGSSRRQPPTATAAGRGMTYQLRASTPPAWMTAARGVGASSANHGCDPNAYFMELQVEPEQLAVDAPGRSSCVPQRDGTFVAVLLLAGKRMRPQQEVLVRYNYSTTAGEARTCCCSPARRGAACCGRLGCTAASHAAALRERAAGDSGGGQRKRARGGG